MWAQCVQGLGVSRSSIRPRTRKGLPAEAAVAGSGSAAVALGRVRVPSEDPLPVPCLRSPHGAGSTPLGRTTALGLGGSSLRSGSPPPHRLHPPASPRVREGKSPPPAPAESSQPGTDPCRLAPGGKFQQSSLAQATALPRRDLAWPWPDLGGGAEPSSAGSPGEEVRGVGQRAGKVHPFPPQTPAEQYTYNQPHTTPSDTPGPRLCSHTQPQGHAGRARRDRSHPPLHWTHTLDNPPTAHSAQSACIFKWTVGAFSVFTGLRDYHHDLVSAFPSPPNETCAPERSLPLSLAPSPPEP